MKAEIRSFRHYAGMSEETEAFTGVLYLDGEAAADLKNDGHGGNNMIFPRPGKRDLVAEWEAEVRAMPPVPSQWGEFPMDPDYFISCLVEEMIEEGWIKRHSRKSMLVRLKGAKPGEWIKFKGRSAAISEHVRQKYGDQIERLV